MFTIYYMGSPWHQVEEFEKDLCEFTNSPFCVTVDSCTNAIFLSLIYNKQFNLLKNQKIIVPEQTYISVPMQVKNAGLIPVLKPIKWFGFYLLENTNIIDSAQKFEKNMYIPDTLQCLSFQFKKHLPIGRGGAILTDNVNAYMWLLKARHDGRNMYKEFGKIENINTIGYHCPLLPYEAVKGRELLFNDNLTGNNTQGNYNNYSKINKNLFV